MSEPYTAHDVVEWTAYLFHGEVDELQRLALSLGDKPLVVNIGAGNGTSTLALLQARPDLRLVSVDKQLDPSPLGCLAGEWAVLDKAGLWPCDRYEFIHGDSAEAGKAWRREPVDMVFIDGDHSYEGCTGDILAWLPHIKPCGIIAVHDFAKGKRWQQGVSERAPHPKPWPGVDRAVREHLVRRYRMCGHVDTLISFRVIEKEAGRP